METYLHTQIRPTVEADMGLSAFDSPIILLEVLPILKYLSSQPAGSKAFIHSRFWLIETDDIS